MVVQYDRRLCAKAVWSEVSYGAKNVSRGAFSAFLCLVDVRDWLLRHTTGRNRAHVQSRLAAGGIIRPQWRDSLEQSMILPFFDYGYL